MKRIIFFISFTCFFTSLSQNLRTLNQNIVDENNNEIIATRKQSYGTWESQLEEIYDNGIDVWKTRIAQVKADNPKE